MCVCGVVQVEWVECSGVAGGLVEWVECGDLCGRVAE